MLLYIDTELKLTYVGSHNLQWQLFLLKWFDLAAPWYATDIIYAMLILNMKIVLGNQPIFDSIKHHDQLPKFPDPIQKNHQIGKSVPIREIGSSLKTPISGYNLTKEE